LTGALEELEHDVAGPGAAAFVDDAVQGVKPFLRLLGVDVGELTGDAVQDGSGFLACHHAVSFLVTSGSLPR